MQSINEVVYTQNFLGYTMHFANESGGLGLALDQHTPVVFVWKRSSTFFCSKK